MRAAYDHYAKCGNLGAGGRRCEAHAFVEAARRLKNAMAGNGAMRREALCFNRRLWTIIQAEITDSRNRLPDDVKAKILSLSIFMDKSATALQYEENTGTLEAMISINRTMAAAQFADAAVR